jgi:hypothetical protein
MKRKILIAAGLLCLGTSPAFAFAIPPMKADMAKAVKDVWADQMAAEQPSAFDTGEAWMGSAPKLGGDTATVRKAAFDVPPDDGLYMGKDKPLDTTLAGELGGAPTRAMKEDGTTAQTADAARPDNAQYTGMGGPLEEVDYPPCSRTVTDRCIQLYERGVHR